MTVKDLLMSNCSDVVSVKLFEPAGPNGEKGKLLCESNGSKYDFEKFFNWEVHVWEMYGDHSTGLKLDVVAWYNE